MGGSKLLMCYTAEDSSFGNKEVNQMNEMKSGIKELVQLLFHYKAKYRDIMHLNSDSVALNAKYATLNEAFIKYKNSAKIKDIQREQQDIESKEKLMKTMRELTEKFKQVKSQDELKRIELANKVEVIHGINAQIQTLKFKLVKSEKIRNQNMSLQAKRKNELDEELTMKSIELFKIKNEKDSLIKDQNESGQKVDELTKNMNEIKRSLVDSQQKYENVVKSKEIEQSRARELGEQLEAMQIENSINEIEIANKNAQNQVLKSEILKVEKMHQQNEADISIAFDKIKNENEALIHKQSDNITEKDLNIQRLNEEIANNERISLSQNDTIKRLQHEIDTNKSEAINLTQKVSELEGLIKEKEIKLNEAEESSIKNKQEYENGIYDLNKSKAEHIDSLKDLVASLRAQESKMDEKYEELWHQKEQLDSKICQKDKDIQLLRDAESASKKSGKAQGFGQWQNEKLKKENRGYIQKIDGLKRFIKPLSLKDKNGYAFDFDIIHSLSRRSSLSEESISIARATKMYDGSMKRNSHKPQFANIRQLMHGDDPKKIKVCLIKSEEKRKDLEIKVLALLDYLKDKDTAHVHFNHLDPSAMDKVDKQHKYQKEIAVLKQQIIALHDEKKLLMPTPRRYSESRSRRSSENSPSNSRVSKWKSRTSLIRKSLRSLA